MICILYLYSVAREGKIFEVSGGCGMGSSAESGCSAHTFNGVVTETCTCDQTLCNGIEEATTAKLTTATTKPTTVKANGNGTAKPRASIRDFILNFQFNFGF